MDAKAIADPAYRSATDLCAAIARKDLGSRELLDHLLARIERYNPALNAVVALDVERARARADAADAALARGERWGPLHGLPMTIKDCFETEGLVTTSGAPALRTHVPATDADAVARLKKAGAVVFGKTNLPIYAGDIQSYNEVYGTTNNPWDTARSPGGSSGGSAAALAAGLTPAELGSDIGGSIRNPAHYCGVVGHKPSYGVISTRGHIPPPPGVMTRPDISVAGPMARTVEDVALLLDILAGPSAWDAPAWSLDLPEPRGGGLAGRRVAVWADDAEAPVDEMVRAAMRTVAAAAESAGATVDPEGRPDIGSEEAHRIYLRLLRPIIAAGLSRKARDHFAEIAASGRQDDFAVFCRDATASHADWIEADAARARLRAAWADFFQRFDLLLCPVTPTAANPHDHDPDWYGRTITVNGSPLPYWRQLFWAGLTGAVYLPSTVIPAGRTPDGLPVGVQIVGPYLGDRGTLHAASVLFEALGGFRAPPGYEG